MSKIIELPRDLIREKDRYFLTYPINFPEKVMALKKVLSSGVVSRQQAFILSGFSKQTYYKMKICHDRGLAYCEENNIDYRNTDYKVIIDVFNMLEECCEQKAFEMIQVAVDQTKDVWGQKDGEKVLLRKGNGELALKIAGRLSDEWNDKKVDININKNENFGVTIEMIDLDNVIDIFAEEQEELVQLTRDKNK